VSGGGLLVDRLRAPFGDAPGLEDISFEVAPGERLVLVGTSGAGKTTLLRAVAGLGPGSAARIEVAGQEVGALPAERRGVVYLHQTPLLFPHLSVAENVAFPLRVRGVARAQIETAVGEVLDALRLGGMGERRPQALSGGQRHRAALARAIVARPPALLLDEPFASLDPELRHEVREAVRAAQEAYRPAMVLVTHDLDEAGALAERIGVLLEGRLAQVATPRELFRRPASLAVARFLRLPNVVPGTIRGDGFFDSVLGTWPIAAAVGSGPGVAVIPADALRLAAGGSLRATVVELRYRVQQTTAVVALGGVLLEVPLDGSRELSAGVEVGLTVSPESVSVFPAR
jgi:ABC-type Fe3+/spermidine/putrescine transport system ATPase subunit